jgi:uncharacterized protein
MLKLLVVVLVVVVVLWLMSSRRGTVQRTPRRAAPKAPETIVACAHCGVHLPRSEALEGRDGRLFCGAAHRLADERSERGGAHE